MLNLRKSLSVKIHKNLPAVKEEYLVQPYCRRGLGEGGAIVTCCSQPGCNWNRETASGNIDINRSHIHSKLSHQLKIVTTPEIVPLNYFCLPIFQIYKLAGLRFISNSTEITSNIETEMLSTSKGKLLHIHPPVGCRHRLS